MGSGGTENNIVGTSVDVDEAAHGIDLAKAVATRLEAAQPEDASEDPVPIRVLGAQAWMIALTRRAPADKNTAWRCAVADLGAHDVPPSGSAFASHAFTEAIGPGRHENVHENFVAARKAKPLLINVDDEAKCLRTAHFRLFRDA